MSEEEPEEWLPEAKTRGRGRRKKDETNDKGPVTKRTAKPKEPKPKVERKPRAPRSLKVKPSVKKEKKEENNHAASRQDEPEPQVQVKQEVRLCMLCCWFCLPYTVLISDSGEAITVI